MGEPMKPELGLYQQAMVDDAHPQQDPGAPNFGSVEGPPSVDSMNVQALMGFAGGFGVAFGGKPTSMSRERFHDHPGAAAAGVLRSPSDRAQMDVVRARRKVVFLILFMECPSWLRSCGG